SETDELPEYDMVGREPVVATIASFVLLGALTTMLFRGAAELEPAAFTHPDAVLAELPERVAREMRTAGLMERGEELARGLDGRYLIDVEARTATVAGES